MHRMSCAQFLENLRRDGSVYKELGRHEAIWPPRLRPTILLADLEREDLSPTVRQWIAVQQRNGRPHLGPHI